MFPNLRHPPVLYSSLLALLPHWHSLQPAMATTTLQSTSGETFDASSMFTCLSCSIAFTSAEDQRAHYRSDHHRYNMKVFNFAPPIERVMLTALQRRVASLPPVSALVFNQKVLERRTETAVISSTKGSSCSICKYVPLLSHLMWASV